MGQADDILDIELLSLNNDKQKQKNQSIEKTQTNGSLRKQCELLQQKHKILKTKNTKKTTQIKALNGKTDDLQASRDQWKNQCKESESKIIFLNESIRKMEVELKKEMKKTLWPQNPVGFSYQELKFVRPDWLFEIQQRLFDRVSCRQENTPRSVSLVTLAF